MSRSTTGTGVSNSSMRNAMILSGGKQRDTVDFDQNTTHLAADGGARGRFSGEELFIYGVVFLEPAAIGQIAVDLDHVLHVATDAAQNGLNILQGLPHLIGKLVRQGAGHGIGAR